MILLSGNVSRPKGSAWFGDRKDLGMMLSPLAWRSPWCQHYACDNDVFAHRSDPSWWTREGETRWLKMLDKIPADRPPLFCVLPDVVGDWAETVYRAWHYLPELRDRGLPVALALQDWPGGIEEVLSGATMLYPTYLFIGGTTRWKWTNAERIVSYAHAIGIKAHVGRAGGINRVKECLRIDADSCDGSQWMTFANVTMPPLLAVMDYQPVPQLKLQLAHAGGAI
jgi:hypothetical protein